MKDEEKRSLKIHAVVDRIEEERIAVLRIGEEEEAQVDFPLAFLPPDTSDGDHLQITISRDDASRESSAQRINSLLSRLQKRSSGSNNSGGGGKDIKL